MKHEEEKYIENKDVAKEENKWSGSGSGRKTINVIFYDIILHLRKLVESVRSYNNKPIGCLDGSVS